LAVGTAIAAAEMVSGCVLDADSRAPIGEARVEIQGSGVVVVTGPSGDFELAAGIGPVGLRILAPGYRSREVLLESGFKEILLERDDDPVFTDSITVDGPPAGPSDGLRVEESLSEEVLRVRPDTSAAEVLQRIAGAIVQRDKGEADRVVLRGAESRLVATSLDGERLASPEGDVRSAGIGLIPTELLEEVRVSKTLTPDMDGDAIGGVVDLVTRKAPAGGLRTVDVSSGWDSEAEGRLGAGSFAVGRRYNQDKLGVLLSASLQGADRGADQLEARYEGDAVERLELRDYDLARERRGLAAALDYSPNDTTDLRAKLFSSSLATDELRRRAKFDLADGEIERELKDSHLEREITSVSLGGDHLLSGGVQVDYRVGAQRASQREPDRIDTSFIQEDVRFTSEGLQPVPVDEDVTRFRLDKIGVENNQTREDDAFAAVNLRVPIGRSDDLGLFRAGLKIRDKSKFQDTNTTIFEPQDDLFLDSFLDPSFSGSGFLRGRYGLVPMVDRGQARGLIDGLGLAGVRSFEEEAADYRAGETISAAYAMAELALGKRLSLLPGVRYEHTASDYRGFEVVAADTLEDSSIRDLSGTQSYGMWLPGIHAAYSVNRDFVLRGAVTRTLARPDYFDLVPYRIFDFEDAELEIGNAALRPTSSWNSDLGLEWRPGNSTGFELALFHKKMTDFIYTRRRNEEISGGLFDVTRPVNGHHATLLGVEASLRHRFGSRVRFLEGFGFELHFTGTSSSAEIDESASTRFRLPGQTALSTQGLLSYHRGRLFGNLSAGWVGEYLLEFGGGRDEDVYIASQRRLDLAAGFSATEWAQVYLHVNNLTDEPLRMYQGSPEKPFRIEYTGWSARAGVRLQF
jgi:TonB-dependent receptor